MEGKDLKPLSMGERLVTVARLLAAEHVRQELASSNELHALSRMESDQSGAKSDRTGSSPGGSSIQASIQQHQFTPASKSKGNGEAA